MGLREGKLKGRTHVRHGMKDRDCQRRYEPHDVEGVCHHWLRLGVHLTGGKLEYETIIVKFEQGQESFYDEPSSEYLPQRTSRRAKAMSGPSPSNPGSS